MTSLLLQLCANLAENLRSLSNANCTSVTKLKASCASCLTSDQQARDVASVVEHHAKSYKAFEASSDHSPHFKQNDQLDLFLQSLVSSSEALIKDLDRRVVASCGTKISTAEAKANHYHHLMTFFEEDKDNAKVAESGQASFSGPRFGSYTMQLRMNQLDHITSVLELLKEVERHATSYFCSCDGAAKQEIDDLEAPKAAQRFIQTRTRLLLSESRVKDDLPKISILTKRLPGFNYSNPSLTTLLSQCYQSSEVCPSPHGEHQKEGVQDNQASADDSQELEALTQLLRALDETSTPSDGQYERFVGEIQVLRSQHEELLQNSNKLLERISDAKVIDDFNVASDITTTKLNDAISHYIFQQQSRPTTRYPVKTRSYRQQTNCSSDIRRSGGPPGIASSRKNGSAEKKESVSVAPPPYTENVPTKTRRWFGGIRWGKPCHDETEGVPV